MSSSGLQLLLTLILTLLEPEPVDINSASAWELQSLPGIGEVTADRIVAFRETFGPFVDIDGLLEVRGIGESTLSGLSGLISACGFAEPDTTHWMPISQPDSVLLEIVFLDVGQGDAILLLPRDGDPCLVDGGPDEGGPLVPAVIRRLDELGVSAVPTLVLTHPHSDHAGGLSEVARSRGSSLMLDPLLVHASPVYERLLQTLLDCGAGCRRLTPGDSLFLAPQVLVRALYVDGRTAGGRRAGEELSVNDRGAVLLVECGELSALLTGDIEEDAERLMTPELDPVVLLKVPHHGSASSLFDPFLNALSPQIAVISCGAGNPFGHPHPSALEAYRRRGAAVLRTDREGTIVVATDGHSVYHHPFTDGECGETPR